MVSPLSVFGLYRTLAEARKRAFAGMAARGLVSQVQAGSGPDSSEGGMAGESRNTVRRPIGR
jgi:hypothetical protein